LPIPPLLPPAATAALPGQGWLLTEGKPPGIRDQEAKGDLQKVAGNANSAIKKAADL
jgi:hypothetical protein